MWKEISSNKEGMLIINSWSKSIIVIGNLKYAKTIWIKD